MMAIKSKFYGSQLSIRRTLRGQQKASADQVANGGTTRSSGPLGEVSDHSLIRQATCRTVMQCNVWRGRRCDGPGSCGYVVEAVEALGAFDSIRFGHENACMRWGMVCEADIGYRISNPSGLVPRVPAEQSRQYKYKYKYNGDFLPLHDGPWRRGLSSGGWACWGRGIQEFRGCLSMRLLAKLVGRLQRTKRVSTQVRIKTEKGRKSYWLADWLTG